MFPVEREALLQARLHEVRTEPEKHRHTFQTLLDCCVIDGVALIELLDAHRNVAGLGHDVLSGPCRCGAWHGPKPSPPVQP